MTERGGSIVFSVRVVPRASKSEIVGALDGALKVRVASPPVDGAANTELIKVLAKSLGVARSQIEIVAGQGSKLKQIRVSGAAAEKLSAVLQA